MNIEQKYENYYFIGIGGIGMSALSRYFNEKGQNIAGYDLTKTDLTEQLEREGINVHYNDDVNMIPKEFTDENAIVKTLVVFTPAIPDYHTELNYFKKIGYKVVKRAQLLGDIAENHFSIAVAGTHGKTTITSMIAHIMKSSNISSTAFLGGLSSNYQTNLIQTGDGDMIIAEADEFDRSFLYLKPNIAVITATDPDHLDVYGDPDSLTNTYAQFVNGIQQNGTLFVKKGLAKHLNAKVPVFEYSIDNKAHYYAENISINNGKYYYDLQTPDGVIEEIELGIPGRHNLENSVAAAAVADHYKVNHIIIKEALKSYKGVKRRFEMIYKSDELIYIDDYAHHPKELIACISSIREMYCHKKITGIFQPHLFSRTRDFAHEFAESLALLDELILLDIYPAREKPIQDVDSQMICNYVNLKSKRVCTKDELLESLDPEKIEVLLTLGAGDIDLLVKPICRLLEKSDDPD